MSNKKKKPCEVPLQDYSRIQLMFLPCALSNGKLFTDYCFPPDKSSLTYVYSGDDKYEKMIFKRPKEISEYSAFAGVGGVYNTPFPWKQWRKCGWFEAAIAVVSLNFKKMDQLIPGYRNFDQCFQNDYIGCFCYKLWRFGDWIDIVVDDHLPTLNNELLYCTAYGSPQEFWAPLVEKAYAKCKKTYEANECGRTLDALTDLTGGICEFFTPDINPPENLFHVLYKSCVNRSQIVCWRNDKLLTPTGFIYNSDTADRPADIKDGRSVTRYLHIVTATTKFPVSDGRMVEMVRLMSAYTAEPVWNGKFADKDELSWTTVNMDFCNKYKPLTNKYDTEYWMTLEDFRCNFGGLIVCSSEVPHTTEGITLKRCYRRLNEGELKPGEKAIFATKERRRSSDMKQLRHTGIHYLSLHRNSHPTIQRYKRRMSVNNTKSSLLNDDSDKRAIEEQGIEVKENQKTVKVDNTRRRGYSVDRMTSEINRKSDFSVNFNIATSCANDDSTLVSCIRKLHLHSGKEKHDNGTTKNSKDTESPLPARKYVKNENSSSSKQKDKPFSNSLAKRHESAKRQESPLKYESSRTDNRSNSIVSNCSLLSECHSTFSTSEITLNMQGSNSRENSLKRPQSAPGTARKASSGSLPNMTVNNFMATSLDNFRSHGSWRLIVDYKGIWEKSETGVSSVDMKIHARNPRILVCILHADAVNQIVAPGYHGKSHVIISLLQDYRHGATTANSLLVPIGFSIYKTKNPSKDEKRSLAKMDLVGEALPSNDVREITSRFDLVPGNYFIVPYCLSEIHSGEFMVRTLAERDPVAGRTGCVVS